MGKIVARKYRMEARVTTRTGTATMSAAWKGAATDKTLRRWVRTFEDSCKVGGANQHMAGTTVIAATLVRREDNVTVAHYTRY